jgi:hypothetical protein
MRTTVVNRRPVARPASNTTPCSRPLVMQIRTREALVAQPHSATVRSAAPWSTAKLGLVVSILAAIAALVVDATTSLPTHAMVLIVMVIAFALSMHATVRRPYSSR